MMGETTFERVQKRKSNNQPEVAVMVATRGGGVIANYQCEGAKK